MFKGIIAHLQKLKWSLRHKVGLAFTIILLGMLIDGLISLFLLFYISSVENQQGKYTLYLQQEQKYSLAYQGELAIYSDAVLITQANQVNDNFREILVNSFYQNLKDASKVAQEFEKQFSSLYNVVYYNANRQPTRSDV
jgi:hypothetical protein